MSRKIRIALIDSGINPTIRCAKAVVSSYALNKRDMLWEINPTSLADSYGHGSAVASIIFSENSNIEIINFQLATDSINIDEEGLLFTLRYISENINVFIPHQLMDLHIRSVRRSQRNRAVCHELHVPRSGRLLGRQGNLLGNIAGRDQLLRIAHVIVFHHHHFQIRAHQRIIVDDLLQHQNQVNDVLGDGHGAVENPAVIRRYKHHNHCYGKKSDKTNRQQMLHRDGKHHLMIKRAETLIFNGSVNFIFGGIKAIASVCEKLVPFMAVFYVLGCLIILVLNRDFVFPAIATI